jgi:hypothetical protein
MTEMTEVYTAFGRAAHYAQLLEYELVSLWMLDSVTKGKSLSHDDLVTSEALWSKKTLGNLIGPLKKSGMVPDGLKEFLDDVLTTRNTLVHQFFLDVTTEIETPSGRQTAVEELEQITAVLTKAKTFFSEVLAGYAKDFGIEYHSIQAELIKEYAKQ